VKIRVALAAVAVLGVVAVPEALAAPPTLLSVGNIDRHATATWSLPSGVEAQVVEAATSPATSSDGAFFSENRVVFDLLEDAQTSWTDNSQLAPGTYYLHISGLDSPCFYASQCPVREYSQIMTLVIPAAAPIPPAPAPVVRATLTVFKLGSGVGTVTSDPSGIDCGSDCTESYQQGGHVMLTAVAAPGSTFTGWENVHCGATPRCELVMFASLTPTARFSLAQPSPTPPIADPPPVVIPASVDVTAPKVRALPAAGLPGSLIRLRFTVNEVSQRTRQLIVVYAGARSLARRTLPMAFTARGSMRSLAYRIPRGAKKNLRFCVVAWDRAGNASGKSCNRLTVIN
jgi:hypothetical protein